MDSQNSWKELDMDSVGFYYLTPSTFATKSKLNN